MTTFSRTTLRELKKRYLNVLKKCLLANLGFIFLSMPAMAESPYIKKEVSSEHENAVLLPEYDKRGNTLTNKYYEIDLKNKSYGNDEVSRTYAVQLFGKEIEIVANYDPEKSNPRYHSPDGDISGTWVDISTKDQLGGAYSNWYGGTITLTGDFVNNIIQNGASTARGGAYGNVYGWEVSSMKGNYIANGALSEGTAQGGAIYSQENLGAPKAIFVANWAKGGTRANGGALVNYGGYSEPVHSHFIGNYAESVSGEAGGGAVFLYGWDIDLEGDFLGNYALSETGTALGGGINLKYRSGYSTSGFSLKGDYIDNKAISKESIAEGGAIYNGEGISLDFIHGMFLYNTAEAKEAKGGAISNTGTIIDLEAQFIGNKAEGTDSAKGGAISNALNAHLTVNSGMFFDNEVVSKEGIAEGGAIHNEGTLIFKGDNIFMRNKSNGTLNDIHNVGTIQVEGGLLTNGGITGSGDIIVKNKGVLDIQTSVLETGSLTLENEGTLKVSLNNHSDYGKVKGLVEGSEASKLSLKLTPDVELGEYQIFDTASDLKVSPNVLFNIEDLNNGSYKIDKKTAHELSQSLKIDENKAKTVEALMVNDSSNEAFNALQDEVLNVLLSESSTAQEKVKKALSAIGASEQSAVQSVASEHIGAVFGVVKGEMAASSTVGRSGGEEKARAKVYIKGLYDHTKSTMGDGFKARSKGAVIGVQSKVSDELTVGVGYAFSDTVTKEEARRTEATTNTAFASIQYQPNQWWLSGLVSYSRGQYDEEKQILSSYGTANYNVDSWGAEIMTGYDVSYKEATITPEIGLRYMSVKQEGYQDTLGTRVGASTSNYLTALVGVKAEWALGAVRPSLGIQFGYDVISDDVSALNTLANGATYTVSGEALDRFSTTLKSGIAIDLTEKSMLKLEYSGTFRKDYQDHSGVSKFEYSF